MRVVVLMPKLGLATGEMPHLRWPPKNWMPGQNLYYLYSACRNLGCDTLVVDANWSVDPIDRVLAHAPQKILISSATPTMSGTLDAVKKLEARGYSGEIYVGGPHVSLNWEKRDFLLPKNSKIKLIPLIGSESTFDWVPTVFPGRSVFDVLGQGDEDSAKDYLRKRWRDESGRDAAESRLEKYIFSFFVPRMDWIDETYRGDHIREDMRDVLLRYSLITSIGCSKSCSFCGNPYIYRIGFMTRSTVQEIVRNFKKHGIDRVSLHDMFFVMSKNHAIQVMDVMREEKMQFSMQTCLENLDDDLLDKLKESGMQKFLVGIENPVSHSVGKTVELSRLRWLLDAVQKREFEGVKLSYIVGLPGTSLAEDFALLDHIMSEIRSRNHPLHDLQVNLYTPYRPEPDSKYAPLDCASKLPPQTTELKIWILDRVPFKYWGSFPVGVASQADLINQMILCDVIYSEVYRDFLPQYKESRVASMQELLLQYPDLFKVLPSFDESIQKYRSGGRSHEKLSQARGNDKHHGQRLSLNVLQ